MKCDNYTVQRNMQFIGDIDASTSSEAMDFAHLFDSYAVLCKNNYNKLMESRRPSYKSRRKTPFTFYANIKWIGYSEYKEYVGDAHDLESCWLSFSCTMSFQRDKSFSPLINTHVGKDNYHNSRQHIRDDMTLITTADNNRENQSAKFWS
ncbi:hypothetical protein COEREDRAFT_12015 [Coemansia reversa NRRL 1564]|uniref:Uncharacterized protein n=1 Tax=Coemansia reversa (strain ATCC 12441 / NRRL 1564) TaxID=763665 RepID=A0A2G5B1M6_COERN|nr:hypothetical protein COEREDRAFT_12015 [Coemansia reversa NRRL 1564]|eukprot:PIA12904.1 hypothetical protein COEREDRAFT_12015 [Coemansia reversa NRRL 1564]